MKRFARTCLLALLLLSLGACARVRPEPPEISLLALQLENLTLSHAILSVDLGLYNPNSFPLTIERAAYSLSLQGIEVAQGRSASGVRIGAGESGSLNLRLSSSYLNLLRIGRQQSGQQDIPFVVDGEVTLAGFGVMTRTLRFREEGVIPLAVFSSLNP